MTPLEEAKHLYLKWELQKYNCEQLGELVNESDFLDHPNKSLLRDYLISVFSESLNNGVSRAFRDSNVKWKRESYHIKNLELANQVGHLPENIHEIPLNEVLVRIPNLEMSETLGIIEELRTSLDRHDYDPIIVVEPADREYTTGAKGTILDGNKRAIALALEGLAEINSIVGDRTL